MDRTPSNRGYLHMIKHISLEKFTRVGGKGTVQNLGGDLEAHGI